MGNPNQTRHLNCSSQEKDVVARERIEAHTVTTEDQRSRGKSSAKVPRARSKARS
jgi:hypothetical protein